MHDAVDKQSRRTPHLTGRHSTFHVPANTLEDLGSGPVAVEQCDVEPEIGGIPPQIVVFERPLVPEKGARAVPEPVLAGGWARPVRSQPAAG